MSTDQRLWDIMIKLSSAYCRRKEQRDKLLGCLEHYWFYLDATTLQDTMFDDEGDILPGKEAAFDALDGTCEIEWDSFTQMANEIRQEMEGQ
jgi:hypothetical protein